MVLFGVWSPDEATFWQSWIAAGICTAPNVFAPNYTGVEVSTSWGGKIARADGTEISGWHANVRVSGQLAEAMTAELPQTDDAGNLLELWDRTWAAQVFQLSEVEIDPTTGFPTGYRNTTTGVKYCDPSRFITPSNVWA